uniref:Secreted protein n=1 Tax=Panagrellus redivivus TaxID=6233 RepID=A0A7E4UZK8_PANRE
MLSSSRRVCILTSEDGVRSPQVSLRKERHMIFLLPRGSTSAVPPPSLSHSSKLAFICFTSMTVLIGSPTHLCDAAAERRYNLVSFVALALSL